MMGQGREDDGQGQSRLGVALRDRVPNRGEILEPGNWIASDEYTAKKMAHCLHEEKGG